MDRLRRSALYLPASNARAIAKARTLDCDTVILDLEDAVAPDAKVAAREQAAAAVAQGGFGRRELVVRINGLDTPWGADDLRVLADVAADAILIPKVDDPATVHRVAAMLPPDSPTRLWAMIETPRAIFRLDAIAAAAASGGRLAALVVGTNDLAKDMRARPGPDRMPFLGFLAMTVAAARAYGLTALDGVYNAFEDDAGLVRECAQAVAFGFDGKTLIHPRQIAPCNAAFAPDATAVAAARAVVAAFARPENADKGAIRIDGAMVERLHLAEAERILATADTPDVAEG